MPQVIKVQTAYRLRALSTGDQVGPFEIAWSNEFSRHVIPRPPVEQMTNSRRTDSELSC